ncbi:TIGR03943 family putative permease subunit [Actinocorallia populi]|uniref:TIGR03943 family putative permease subunit n=1 Tax=Actinocorallia populi TaxID=2079200 RepID=UPI0013009F1E|nr:TIGR03943 family protein [Actinocorallia populi]
MSRAMQNLLMVLVGGAVLWITLVTGEVVNFVKEGLRWPLVAAAAVLVVLGLAGMRRDWRDRPDEHADSGHDGHGHGAGGPRVAWLLCLPVLAIFAIAPPELGVFTAARTGESRAAAPPKIQVAEDDYALPPSPDPYPMSVGEFMGRSFEAQIGGQVTLADRRLELKGFATPGERGAWYLTRLQMSCCAADAMPLKVKILDAPAPEKGSWVKVVGLWHPAGEAGGRGVYEFTAQSVTRTEKPDNPYE